MKKFLDKQHDQATVQEALTGNKGSAAMPADLQILIFFPAKTLCIVLKKVDRFKNREAKVKNHKNPPRFLWFFCARPLASFHFEGAFY